MSSLTIIYEDKHFIAICKPAGIPVHASQLNPGKNNVVDLLSEQLGCRIYNTHRLDRPTSGILLLARSSEASRELNNLFARKEVYKRYFAVVRGWFPPVMEIDRPLKKEKTGDLQEAFTRVRCLEQSEKPFTNDRYDSTRYSLVAAVPETGRNHQIRRHLNGAAYPIIGDTTHGDLRHNRIASENLNVYRLMLHAGELELSHPFSGKKLSLKASFPADFYNAAVGFGFDIEQWQVV